MILAIEDATVGRDEPAHIGNPQGHTHVATRGRTRARTRNGAREGGEGAPQDGRGLGNEASYGSSVDETISRPRRPQATPRLQGTVHPPAPRHSSGPHTHRARRTQPGSARTFRHRASGKRKQVGGSRPGVPCQISGLFEPSGKSGDSPSPPPFLRPRPTGRTILRTSREAHCAEVCSVTMSSRMKVASGRRDSGFNTQQVGSKGDDGMVMTE